MSDTPLSSEAAASSSLMIYSFIRASFSLLSEGMK